MLIANSMLTKRVIQLYQLVRFKSHGKPKSQQTIHTAKKKDRADDKERETNCVMCILKHSTNARIAVFHLDVM